MKVYISGAITGKPDGNKRAFQNAHRQIAGLKKYTELQNLEIINPIHIGKILEKQFSIMKKGKPGWPDYMKACIKELCDVSCVYFLPDWVGSDGANVERYIAVRLGIPCADSIDILVNELKKILEEKHEQNY